MYSAILIIPAAHLTGINALGDVSGYGPDNYTIPLAPPDAETPTHYAGRVDVSGAWLAQMQAAREALPPADWSAYGVTAEDVSAALAALDVDLCPVPGSEEPPRYADPRAHLEGAAADRGLVVL